MIGRKNVMNKKKCSGIIAEIATVFFLLLNGLNIPLRHNTRQWVRGVVDHPAYEPACRVLFAVALAAWIVYWVLVYQEKRR